MNEQFEEFIKALIQDECTRDKDLKALTEKQNKSTKECAKYVIGEAYKIAKKNHNMWYGIDNGPIVNLIVHYYTEDDIKVEGLPGNVGVSTTPPKAEPKAAPKVRPTKAKTKKEEKSNVVQLDLFGE